MKMRAILFINGDITDYTFIPKIIRENDLLVAVDGGLRHIQAIDRVPHLLIGDLDSVSRDQINALEAQGVEILRFPVEKDETDLELALLEAVRRKYENIILIGALGGRIDQTLANLFLLSLEELSGKKVRILERNQEIFIITGHDEIEGSQGDIVSLLPLVDDAAGVNTTGLKFPLVNEKLFIEHSRGISNQMTGSLASVSVTNGILLCIHSWK